MEHRRTKSTCGVLHTLVQAPGGATHPSPHLHRHQWFVKDPDFDTRRVVVFAYRHTAAQAAKMVTPPKALVSYPMYETSPDTPAALKDGLDNLLEAVNRQAGR